MNRYSYEDAIAYLKTHGVDCTPGSRSRKRIDDLLDGNALWIDGEEVYAISLLKSIIDRMIDHPIEEDLEKPASADPEVNAYNAALKMAKAHNKPVVYGYKRANSSKFYPITPKEYHGDDNAFRAQYKASTIRVAYPDKDFVESLQEGVHIDPVTHEDKELLDLFLKSAPLDSVKEELSPFERRKQRAVETYNKFKNWASDAKERTSCLCNISVEQLNEWIGESNDKTEVK